MAQGLVGRPHHRGRDLRDGPGSRHRHHRRLCLRRPRAVRHRPAGRHARHRDPRVHSSDPVGRTPPPLGPHPMHMPSLLEHRPGDAPHLFDLGTGAVAIGADGKVVRFTQPGLVMALHPVALEPARLVYWYVAWRRHADGPDPANDAVSAGVDWLDANKMILARRLITTDTELLVESGRRTAARLVGPTGMAKAELEAPLDARYVRPWVEVFGTGHATDIEVCACLEVPAKSLSTEEIDAPDVLFPEGFQWPGRVIPPIPITPTTQDGPEPGLYQPAPNTLIPVDWVAPAEIAQTIFVSGGGADTNGGRDVRDAFRSIEQ